MSVTGRLSTGEPELQNIKPKAKPIYKVCVNCKRTEIGGGHWSDKLCPKHHVILEESRVAAGINIVCRACLFNHPVPLDTRHVTCPDCEAKA